MEINKIEDLIGKTVWSYERTNDTLTFMLDGQVKIRFYHEQDCCESVYIEDIVGDLEDLVGHPLITAEERRESGGTEDGDSSTWTFYEFATIKGYVTVRWLGTSNGYYSESVSYALEIPEEIEVAKAILKRYE
jgi:hypothetical protein